MRIRHLILLSFAVLALLGGSSVGAASAKAQTRSKAKPRPQARSRPKAKRATNAPANAGSPMSGGAGIGVPPSSAPSTPSDPVVQGSVAKIVDGLAYAPSLAPIQVQRAIWAGNAIRHKPYIYGGGHGSFNAAGYDCSGSVSYLMHAAGLLSSPDDSSAFMSWGLRGAGHWITVYTNPAHAFVEIAGIRMDTSAEGDPNPSAGSESGPRWRPLLKHTSGFVVRHPSGF